jgi:predicted Zn-dependent peptidase
MGLVRSYLGSLPARELINGSLFAELRGIKPNPGPLRAHEDVKSLTDKSIALTGFFGVDGRNLEEVRGMNMAAKILTTRATKQIREEKQLAYSPQVDSAPGVEYPALGLFALVTSTAPDKLPSLMASVTELYTAFAKDGPTEEELETAKKQFANTFDQQLREPAYWADTLRALDLHGRSLESILDAPAAYQGMTAEQVRNLFGKYFKPAGTFEISASPVH